MCSLFSCVCLFVCFSVCPQHNSKTNDQTISKCSNLVYGMTLRYFTCDLGVERSNVKVTGLISAFHTDDYYAYVNVQQQYGVGSDSMSAC